MYNDQFCGPEPFKLVLLMFSLDILLKSLQTMKTSRKPHLTTFCESFILVKPRCLALALPPLDHPPTRPSPILTWFAVLLNVVFTYSVVFLPIFSTWFLYVLWTFSAWPFSIAVFFYCCLYHDESWNYCFWPSSRKPQIMLGRPWLSYTLLL